MLALATREQMPQFFLLRLQILFRMFRGRDFAGHAFRHSNAGAFQRGDFIGIVRQQADSPNVQRHQDLNRHEELALVGFETKALIGLYRVKSAVLERVGLQFRHQANAASFLLFIDKDARPLMGDHRERHFKLLTAIAAQGSEDVSGQALGVNSHKRRFRKIVAHDQRDRFFDLASVRGVRGEAVNTKLSPAGWEVRGRYLLYARFTHNKIISRGRQQKANRHL